MTDPDRASQRRDVLALLLVTLIAAAIRVRYLSAPPGFVFDEFYASDGCLYFGGAPSVCRTGQEITIVHPPLAKWLIGIGVWALGFREVGWRIASAVAGALTVPALYLLTRTLLRSTLAASVASGLLAIDFLHIVFSRTAMLDVFVTFFIVVAFLFLAVYRDALIASRDGSASSRWRWLALAGLSAGAAGASKWSAWPCLLAMAVLALAWEIEVRGRARAEAPNLLRILGAALPPIVVCLVVVPLAVYVLSFAGRLDGRLMTWPWADDAWIRAFVERQRFMTTFHRTLSGAHPFTSPAWSWLLLKRPVLMYYRETTRDGLYQVVLAFGSPLVWWSAIAALLYLSVDWFRRRSFLNSTSVILAAFASCYVPWLLLGHSRQQVFNYYLLPAVPFMCMALGAVAEKLVRGFVARVILATYLICAIALFLFFRPIIVGKPLTHAQWQARMLFRDCDHQPGALLRPQTASGPPPRGWCWP